MKKQLMTLAIVCGGMALAVPAFAEDHGTHAGGVKNGEMMMHKGPQSRQEAIEKAQKRLDKLNGMTDAQWEEKRKKRMERKAEWEAMTPEQREAKKKAWDEKRQNMKDGKDGMMGDEGE